MMKFKSLEKEEKGKKEKRKKKRDRDLDSFCCTQLLVDEHNVICAKRNPFPHQ
tara:strand:+ start:182 stop:340 length:159 start_codon:yes stop_codon:yes gene_type:complete